MAELHKTQLGILNKLLFGTELRYTDLKFNPEIENNTFQFHLDKVIEAGYVTKNSEGMYSLTKEGKKVATHIDTDSNRVVKRRKVSVALFCIRDGENGLETLFYTRLKHPFYGKQGFPAGKVFHGENFKDAASRELKEETNLVGDPVLFGITHYLVIEEDSKDLLDDKIFLNFFIKNPKGQLKGNNEGEFKWIPLDNLAEHIKNPFDTVEVYERKFEKIKAYENDGKVHFEELEHITQDF